VRVCVVCVCMCGGTADCVCDVCVFVVLLVMVNDALFVWLLANTVKNHNNNNNNKPQTHTHTHTTFQIVVFSAYSSNYYQCSSNENHTLDAELEQQQAIVHAQQIQEQEE